MTRFERDGRWCEVSKIRYSYFNGEPCYEVDGRGDLDMYLGGTAPLYVEETRGGWTIGYQPNDDDFKQYANDLIRLDAWH